MVNNTYVVPENVSRTLGKDAQRNNILAAKVIADIVKTTLGPKGMDKMLVDSTGNIVVTNDGVTILQEIEIDHPAAKMMVEIAKTQENEVGDGTTTAALLGGKLLERAEILLDKKIHPTVIVKGYRIAAEKANNILNEISFNMESKDKEILENIAKTAMTGKGAESYKEKLAKIIVEAVEAIAEGKNADINSIKIEKLIGGDVNYSELVKGIVIKKKRVNISMPSVVNNARILLIDFPLEVKNPEAETRLSISSPEQLDSFIEHEENYIKELCDVIIKSGANVVICQKGIDELVQYYLARAGIIALRRVEKEDMGKLARATSGKIVSNFKEINYEQLGRAEIVEELNKANETLVYVRGCVNPRAVTLVLCGGTEHVVDEIERAVKDGLGDVISALNSSKIVCGGGAVEIELSRRLRIFSKTIGGREQMAIDEFATALESIPEALAENAGLDPIDIITELKKRHEAGAVKDGLNLFNDKIEDTLKAGIIEPLKVKTQAISSASEVAMMILRIDDVLISKGNSKKEEMGID